MCLGDISLIVTSILGPIETEKKELSVWNSQGSHSTWTRPWRISRKCYCYSNHVLYSDSLVETCQSILKFLTWGTNWWVGKYLFEKILPCSGSFKRCSGGPLVSTGSMCIASTNQGLKILEQKFQRVPNSWTGSYLHSTYIYNYLPRSPGDGSGNPLQYSCLENAMNRGAWWATVH